MWKKIKDVFWKIILWHIELKKKNDDEFARLKALDRRIRNAKTVEECEQIGRELKEKR